MSVKGSWSRVRNKSTYDENFSAIFRKSNAAKTPHVVSTGDSGRRQGEPELLEKQGQGAGDATRTVSRAKG